MGIRSVLSGIFATLLLFLTFICVLAVPSVQAQDKIVVAQSDISEKEAYEAAKELGTIEAWEAFLENFPKGFRADLARAYVKRLGSEDAPVAVERPAPAETPVAETPPPPPPPADISLAITSQDICKAGRICSLTVTATNAGGEPFTGDLTIATSLSPGGADLQGTGTPPFSCEGAGGGAICSTGLANIPPGQSATIPMTFTLPRNAGGQVTTCASIAWGGVPSSLGAREVQRKLNELGFNAGPADGQPGRKTLSAIRAFQRSAGIQQTGEIDLPLLLALFAPGGEGDSNPVNDQACSGAAVTQAPPLPAAYQGPAQPAWTPPSSYGKVNRKAKPKKCSSRSVWLEGQCILKSQVRSFCGPGFSRQGSRCVSNAAAPTPAGPAVVGCSGNAVRIGNVCVNISNAPVFGGRPGRGGGQNFTGGGNRLNRPQGGPSGSGSRLTEAQVRAELLSHCNSLGLDNMRKPGTNQRAFNSCANSSSSMAKSVMTATQKTNISQRQAINGFKEELNAGAAAYNKTIAKQNQQGGQAATQQGGALKCPAGEVASLWGCVKQPIPICPPGVPHRATPDRRVLCDNAVPPPVVKAAPPPPPPPIVKGGQKTAPKMVVKCIGGQTVGTNCQCPAGQTAKSMISRRDADGNSTVTFQCMAQGIKCGPGMVAQGNTCVSAKPQGGATKQILCPSNLVPQNGKCGCPPGLTWDGKVCAAQQPRPTTAPPPQQQAVPQRVNCTGGRVANANGQCRCPPNLPRWNGSICKAAKKSNTDKVNNFLKQLQQPQQQPQQQQNQQQQNQQQQQLQQGLQQLNKILSDRRAKRDVIHVATRADGLKLYSFRYLWDARLYVGVMAQDLLDDPARAGAVSLHPSGYYRVDYGMLGLRMETLRDWQSASR